MQAMFEVVLYATLAVIMVVVLWSVLGQQVGRGPDEDTKPEDIFGTTQDFKPEEKRPVLPETAMAAAVSPVALSATPLDALRAREPGFDPRVFEDQATTAYSMVLEAFASGDRDTLELLLTPRMAGIYNEAIADRERQELTQVTDILRVVDAEITDTRVDGDTGQLDVRFRSELSSALVDAVGQPVLGDPDIVAKVREVWTFERELGSDDPTWRLSDVAPEEGDALPADPAPDTTE